METDAFYYLSFPVVPTKNIFCGFRAVRAHVQNRGNPSSSKFRQTLKQGLKDTIPRKVHVCRLYTTLSKNPNKLTFYSWSTHYPILYHCYNSATNVFCKHSNDGGNKWATFEFKQSYCCTEHHTYEHNVETWWWKIKHIYFSSTKDISRSNRNRRSIDFRRPLPSLRWIKI